MENLKPCRDCKAMVSTSAQTCPRCGMRHPAGTPLYYGFARIIVVFWGVIVATSLLKIASPG